MATLLDCLQEDLPALYRGHDVFLFTSRYEAWGMPVLEAMASGLAVVATRCLGVNSFSQHLLNCLLADPLVGHLCVPRSVGSFSQLNVHHRDRCKFATAATYMLACKASNVVRM